MPRAQETYGVPIGTVSEPHVMQSAAGFYIGTSYLDECGAWFPNSRDSTYFPTRESAQAYLDWENADQDDYPDPATFALAAKHDHE